MVCCKTEDSRVIFLVVKAVVCQALEVASWREVLFHTHLMMDEKGSEILLGVVHHCLLHRKLRAGVEIRQV